MNAAAPDTLPIFRSPAQAAILSRLFLTTDQLTISDLARTLHIAIPTAHREASRLERAGLLRSTVVGRNRMMSANPEHPAAEHLTGLLEIIAGLPN